MPIENRRILITGGTSGIGLALAAALKRRGAEVTICGRDGDRVTRTCQRLDVHGSRCDVADPQQLESLLETADAAMGGIDVLIHNAGVQRAIEIEGQDPAAVVDGSLTRELEVNLAGPIRLTALALPRLRRSTHPVLVFVTSALALAPKPSAPVYCASKAGLRSFAKAMRHQLEPLGVRVLEVVPPVVDTAMTAGRDEEKMAPEAVAERIVRALAGGRSETRIGKIRFLHWLHRLAPGVAERILATR